MARPPRFQLAGGVFHVTARGNRGQPTFLRDEDRQRFLDILAVVIAKLGWKCHSYCLMTNHYHLLVEIPAESLSEGIQILNGQYAQWFNREHGFNGHLFQGRFHSVHVAKDSHVLELARYIALNPVRAGLCDDAGAWPWSSYRATMGKIPLPSHLKPDWLLAQFGGDPEHGRIVFSRFVGAALAAARARPP